MADKVRYKRTPDGVLMAIGKISEELAEESPLDVQMAKVISKTDNGIKFPIEEIRQKLDKKIDLSGFKHVGKRVK